MPSVHIWLRGEPYALAVVPQITNSNLYAHVWVAHILVAKFAQVFTPLTVEVDVEVISCRAIVESYGE